MSFVAPPPPAPAAVAARASPFLSAPLGAASRRALRPSAAPVPVPAAANLFSWLPWPPRTPVASRGATPPSSDFRTMFDATDAPDNACFTGVVLHAQPVSPARDHVQLTLDVSAAALAQTHVAPGQFVQLSRDMSSMFGRRARRASCFATIASPPGGVDGCFQFLISTKSDPLKLSALKPGEKVNVSPVMGSGLDYLPLVQSKGNLYLFADAPQGFAAAKSLIEWGNFRSASGEGANRVNHVTIYYAMPTSMSLPYGDKLSSWSVYGVNVVPLPGLSILEYLSQRDSVGNSTSARGNDFAMACVSSSDTYEALLCSLILFGFRRSAINSYTPEIITREFLAFDESEEVDMPAEEPIWGDMPGDMDHQMKRSRVERKVWEGWVHVREEMRAEFERKWAAQARMHKGMRQGEKEKQQAWASWFAKNSSQWNQAAWDNEQWSQYWSSWNDTRGGWYQGSESSRSRKSWNGDSQDKKQHWSQQNSEEFWDWVGRGAGKGRSSASRGNGRPSSDSTGWYEHVYGGSQSYGNANNQSSGYQKGGYRYQYDEERDDKSKNSSSSWSSSTGSSSGTGWSGWNRNTKSSKRSSSSGGQRSWNSGGARRSPFDGDLDFYSLLGIESGASRNDIKRAYRKKAMEHHPDRNPERSEEAHVMMKQIVVAWTVLKDEESRRKYDKYGPAGL